MKIGNNVAVRWHTFYDPHHAPYVGFSGTITATRTIDKSTRYQVQFTDGKKLWFFEKELESEWAGQKQAHQKDLLEAKDETKKPYLKAGLVICLQNI